MWVNTKEFKKAIKSVVSSTSKEKNRKLLTGIHFLFDKEENTLTLEACDGFRIFITNINVLSAYDDEMFFDIVIPIPEITSGDEDVEIEYKADGFLHIDGRAYKPIDNNWINTTPFWEECNNRDALKIKINAGFLRDAVEHYKRNTVLGIEIAKEFTNIKPLLIYDDDNRGNRRMILPIR